MVDLTPLLDVVLILLFALLMNMSMEQDAYKAQAQEVDEEMKESEQENEALSKLIQEQKEQIEKLETNISGLDEQKKLLDEALVTWFANEEIRDQDLVTNEDFAKILDIDQTNQSLSEMNFISNQFFFIEVSIDSSQFHQVLINGQETYVQLNSDKSGDAQQIEKASVELYDFIDKELVSQKGGYSFVLFTLVDDGHAYKYALDLIWEVFKEFEDKEKDQRIYKLKYLNY